VRSMLRPPAALVALLCLALAGCGGGGSDVDSLLKQTFNGHRKVRSGKLDLGLTVASSGAAASGPFALRLQGPFQGQGKQLPKFDFTVSINAARQTFTAGAVTTGDQGFIKLQGTPYSLSPDVFAQFKRGYEQSQSQRNGSSRNPSFSSLGINPRGWLKGAKVVGDARVGGADTKHISAGVDVAKMLADVSRLLQRASKLGIAQAQRVPTSLTPQQRDQIRKAVRKAHLDLYTGKGDKTLRRLTVRIDFNSSRLSSGSLGSGAGTLAFDLVIADLNKDQSIAAPANPRPFSELATALRGIAGAATGGATTPPATGSTTPPSSGSGSTGALGSYSACLQQAAGDIAKAQRCASLLPK
jgi:hypothetical protein